MAGEIVRCPYCAMGSEFRPMLRRSRKFVCLACGHRTALDDPFTKCGCPKCQKMSLLASRCRTSEELRKRLLPPVSGLSRDGESASSSTSYAGGK